MRPTKELLTARFRKLMSRGNLHNAAEEIMDLLVMSYENCGGPIKYEDIGEIVATLDDFGYFELRNAVVIASRKLHVSRNTLYKYLSKP